MAAYVKLKLKVGTVGDRLGEGKQAGGKRPRQHNGRLARDGVEAGVDDCASLNCDSKFVE
eukprot:6172691-Pleurochrysis_carterae.AAC.1